MVFALLLALAADYFAVPQDPRLDAIMAILPGTNDGACGAAGCRDFAEQLIAGKMTVGGCVVGGALVAEKLAGLMGVSGEAVRRNVAAVHCGARENQRKKKGNYAGVRTCGAANLVAGGGLMCLYGCLGYGDCQGVCQFDAIRMEEGLPVIDPAKCTACGKCLTACPRKIISLRPDDFPVIVACSSLDPGAVTRKICPVGCIGCKICVKEMPDLFRLSNNLAVMDYSKPGIDCAAAVEKCPTKCIVKY